MAVLNWLTKAALANGGSWAALGSDGTDIYIAEEVFSGVYATGIAHSTDEGDSWAAVAGINTSFEAYSIAHDGAGVWVVVGNGLGGTTAMYKRNSAGVWSSGTMPVSTSAWWATAWNGTKFCSVRRSPAGANGAANASVTAGALNAWTGRTITVGGDPAICAHGTRFIVVGTTEANALVSTNDGDTWATAGPMPSVGWMGVASNGTRLVAVKTDNVAYSDDNGASWTNVALTGGWTDIVWNGTYFCAVDGNENFATSTSGVAWVTDTQASFTPTMLSPHGGNFVALFQNDLFVSEPGFVEFWTNEVLAQELDL